MKIIYDFKEIMHEQVCWKMFLLTPVIIKCLVDTMLQFVLNMYTDLSRIVTKPTKWHVRPAKTQISLGIRPVWSEFSLSAWRKLESLATH